MDQFSGGGSAAGRLLNFIDAGEAGDQAVKDAIAVTGEVLGTSVAQFAKLIHPEMVILAGPLSRSGIYMDAVANTVRDLVGEGLADVPIVVSGMPPRTAACCLAVNEFLIEKDIDIEGLKDRAPV